MLVGEKSFDVLGSCASVASFERKQRNESNMKIINLTPHVVRLNDGREFQPSGTVARVASVYSTFDANGIASVSFGAVQGLPDPETGTVYVASALVASAAHRADVVSPATGHKDCVRKDGQVFSVPGFVRG